MDLKENESHKILSRLDVLVASMAMSVASPVRVDRGAMKG